MTNLPVLDPAVGGAIPTEVQRIAEVINDYDHSLEMRWIEPKDRTSFDAKPFAIFHNVPTMEGGGYYVMHLTQKQAADPRVLATLFRARNSSISEVEAFENAQNALKMKAQMEEQEERHEFINWAWNSDKTVKHNGVVYK